MSKLGDKIDHIALRKQAEEKVSLKESITPENIESLSSEEIKAKLHELRVHQIELEMQNEELHTTQEELDASRARYFELYDLAPVGYMTLTRERVIVESNLTAAALLGVAHTSLAKQPLNRFILKEDQDVFYLHSKQLLETRKPQSCELRMKKNNGTHFWAYLEATVAMDDHDEVVFRVVMNDITERKQIEHALAAEKERLAKASIYKTQFLANMSHELRTPLNSILILSGCLEENEEGNLTAEQVTQTGIIKNSCKQLHDIINDILDLSKVEAGQLDINEDVITLESFCHSLELFFAMEAAERGLDLRIECDSTMPQYLLSDERRLRQIINNLISNALKFTHEGAVVLKVKSGENGTIAFVVSDSGIGIAPEKQNDIFEAFQQADGSTIRKYGGTGLGLTISRKLTGLLGGTIEVESEEGQGTVFTVLLPNKTVTEETMAQEEPPLFVDKPSAVEELMPVKEPLLAKKPLTAQQSFSTTKDYETSEQPHDRQNIEKLAGKTILVVDDDMRNIFVISAVLNTAGVITVLAEDGEQALDRVAANPDIDLILMDMMMPNMGGYEATSRIRLMEGYNEIPIIAFTAMAMEGDREKCLAAGVSDFLAKPVDKEKLFEVIGRVLV